MFYPSRPLSKLHTCAARGAARSPAPHVTQMYPALSYTIILPPLDPTDLTSLLCPRPTLHFASPTTNPIPSPLRVPDAISHRPKKVNKKNLRTHDGFEKKRFDLNCVTFFGIRKFTIKNNFCNCAKSKKTQKVTLCAQPFFHPTHRKISWGGNQFRQFLPFIVAGATNEPTSPTRVWSIIQRAQR